MNANSRGLFNISLSRAYRMQILLADYVGRKVFFFNSCVLLRSYTVMIWEEKKKEKTVRAVDRKNVLRLNEFHIVQRQVTEC